MNDLAPSVIAELDALCAHAGRVVEDTRHLSIEAALPRRTAALDAITHRLVDAGVEQHIAENTVTRWLITRQPITECLAVETDPPYPTKRRVPGVARTRSRGPR